jgi:hypothetical protein
MRRLTRSTTAIALLTALSSATSAQVGYSPSVGWTNPGCFSSSILPVTVGVYPYSFPVLGPATTGLYGICAPSGQQSPWLVGWLGYSTVPVDVYTGSGGDPSFTPQNGPTNSIESLLETTDEPGGGPDNGLQIYQETPGLQTTTTPEPGSILLVATGLVGIVVIKRNRRRTTGTRD